jgi:hypothetical protein
MWTKLKDWWTKKMWPLLKKGLKQLVSPLTDEDYALDVYRLGGIAAYVVAGIIALKTADLLSVTTVETQRLIVGSGLASFMGGLGTALFGQARKADAAILSAQPKTPAAPSI